MYAQKTLTKKFEFPLPILVTQDYRNVAKTKFVTLSSWFGLARLLTGFSG